MLNYGQTQWVPVDMWVLWTQTSYQPYIQWGQSIEYRVQSRNWDLPGDYSNSVIARLPSDQYNDIARWMTGEMARNSRSQAIRDIHWYNTDCFRQPGADPLACRGGAAWRFIDLVKTGAIWDHKPVILRYFDDRDRYYSDIPGTSWKIYFDVWSNIHFGFVGRAGGFSRQDLILGSHIAEGAGHTDAGDDLSVNIGMDLWEQYGPGGLTTARLDAAIRARLSGYRQATGDLHVRYVHNFS